MDTAQVRQVAAAIVGNMLDLFRAPENRAPGRTTMVVNGREVAWSVIAAIDAASDLSTVSLEVRAQAGKLILSALHDAAEVPKSRRGLWSPIDAWEMALSLVELRIALTRIKNEFEGWPGRGTITNEDERYADLVIGAQRVRLRWSPRSPNDPKPWHVDHSVTDALLVRAALSCTPEIRDDYDVARVDE